jgi:hypothetical protein
MIGHQQPINGTFKIAISQAIQYLSKKTFRAYYAPVYACILLKASFDNSVIRLYAHSLASYLN